MSDPFSSFGGEGSTARFKQNADNLGRLTLNPSLKITSFDFDEAAYTVTVGWSFYSLLKLPFGRTPVLAAAGATIHTLDRETGLIIYYKEEWKSDPWKVVKRLLTTIFQTPKTQKRSQSPEDF